jgi:hypothetical protein
MGHQFAPENRWGYFPSLSAGWVITKEDFMSSTASILNFAKLRASWGQNGNQDISPFQFSSQIAYAFPGYFLEILSQFLVQQLILKQYQILTLLETSEQLDFGLDAKLFDSRLGMTLDWYKKQPKTGW